jgi:hypothetical protein
MNKLTPEKVLEEFENYLYLLCSSGYKAEDYTTREYRLMWLSDELCEMATYDSDLDVLFGKEIFEVIKVILDRTWVEYIKDEANYIKFIRCANLLGNNIEWGTSIRGCWFNDVKMFEWIVREFIGDE